MVVEENSDQNLDLLCWIRKDRRFSYKKRILGECILVSSFTGKALRTLVDIARLAERFNMLSQSRAW